MLEFTMVLLLIGVFWFLWFRTNNKQRWKKVIFSVLSIFIFGITLIASNVDAETSTSLNNEVEKNEELTEKITTLETDHSELQEQFDEIDLMITELNEEIKTLSNENEKLQKDLDSTQEENDTLTEESTQLEKDNKALQKKLDEKKEPTASNAETESVKSNVGSDNSSKSSSDSGASDESTSSETEQASTATASESTTEDTEDAADCDIKGSVNGIYHTPGSTYYSRTKNVEQWFCSTQEAENAGYRAPER